MKLTVLGAGTFVAEINRTASGYLLEIEDKKIIFDFGRGTIRNLLELGHNLENLDKIFISHVHADHLLELINFIIHLVINPDKKRKYGLDISDKKYQVYGPEGLKNSINSILDAVSFNKQNLEEIISIKEIAPKQILTFDNYTIVPFQAMHNKGLNALGYRVKKSEKIFFYSGDTTYCESIIEGAKDADLAIIEACLKSSENHMNGIEAGLVATKANVKLLMLTHIARTYLSDVEEDLRKTYGGKYLIAEDKLCVKF